MNRINPLNNAQFPASSETWDFLKEMTLAVARLASLGGQNYILSGCVDNGNSVGDGWVVIAGELLPFHGGPKSENIIVVETNDNVVAAGVTYNNIYTKRIARFGVGVTTYQWNTFSQVASISALATSLSLLWNSIGNNQNFAQTMTNAIGAKVDLNVYQAAINGIGQTLASKANANYVYTKAECGNLLTKVIPFYWDMVGSDQIIMAHGLSVDKIISLEAYINSNDKSFKVPLVWVSTFPNNYVQGNFYIDDDYVFLARRRSGYFEQSMYSGTTIIRGHVIIKYIV